MKILDGKQTAQEILKEIKEKIVELIDDEQRVPHLAVILVGSDPASQTYVKNKAKACQKNGLLSSVYELEAKTTQEELIEAIHFLNQDDEVDGILVQLPLPKHIDEISVINAIDPSKDVDGLHPVNAGRLSLNQEGFVPCTPKGIMTLLKHYDINVSGKEVVIVGRSHLVGKPLSQLMLNENATVTVCHSKTKDLKSHTTKADILVVAIGRQEFIHDEYVKEGVVLVDVGINRDEYGIHGDCDESAYQKASYYTPVPKGVGPMTIAMLIENTMESYWRRENG